MDAVQQVNPYVRSNRQVQESFDDIIVGNGRFVRLQVFSDFLPGLFRSFLRKFQKREHYHCQVARKLFLRLLQLHHGGGNLRSVQLLHSVDDGSCKFVFYFHVYIFVRLFFTLCAKVRIIFKFLRLLSSYVCNVLAK